ncbi:hypothetical protein NPIL_111601, partial [Nephila pilipes]
FSTLDRETQQHIAIRPNESWFKPIELARECDVYFVAKRKSYSDSKQYRQHPSDSKQKYNPTQGFNGYYSRDKKFRNCSRNASANNPRGDYHRNETHFKSRPNSNHGPVCKVEGKMFNELPYENIFVSDKIVKTLIDSGANIVCVKSSLIPPETKNFGTVQLTCAFGNEIQAQLTKIKLALPSFRKNPIIVTAAICNKLYCDLIVPPNIFDDLNKAEKENARISEKNPVSSHSEKNFLPH